ncbi:MAG: hypothetical protein DRI69_01085 [Bacteroidetes bacterium]|nr:MAG: hypothetical protein DRI69_01085 [Bacteroidota bacterium]
MKFILLTFISLFFLSCSNTTETDKDDKQETEWATQEPKPAAQVEVTNFKTKSGKEFTVIEKKRSGSLSRITIQGTGFPNSQEIFTLRDVDPFEAGLKGDLDNDGFEEIYLITRAVGSGSYAGIYGYASYNDLSYGPIYLAEPTENDPNFRGYMGHDRISIIDNRLVREFPVFNMGDTNNAPSGGYRIIKYTLEKGEASFALKIESVTSRARKSTPPS